jgi:CheY-like chemotaxis protein
VYQKLDPTRAIFQLSRLLSDGGADSGRLVNRALKHIALCTGADRIFLSAWTEATATLRTVAQWHIEQLDPMPSRPVRLEGFSLLDAYFTQNRGLFLMQKEPVFHNHQLIGVCCLESRDSINRLSVDEQNFIRHATHMLAPFLQVLELPAEEDDANDDMNLQEISQLSRCEMGGAQPDADTPLVLIVEDNKINQLTILKMLERCGVAVHTADDGLKCISACQKQKYALILMDLSMPHMDGFDTTREILTSCPFNRETPIVAVTAHTGEEMQKRSLKVGMAEFIPKPLRTQRIRELVGKYIHQTV